ncbi:MAG TPA: folylpolyglutamate synthase/dihydrofolate synthase family protein [Armatimonadota bacterium]|nr:folylpolyglutamate synthase/dihydrofolate synthase family protein [Armatimonadota bacterium]
MTYEEAQQYLWGLINYEKTPAHTATARYLNLDRMYEVLRRAGDPHQHLRFVHIAGTKGKGSTAAMTASMLQAAGYRVGLFTSPHLITFRERIRLNNELISEDDLTRLVEEIRPILDGMQTSDVGKPTLFETYTLLAFRWFLQQQADIVVLETGMGGRLDSTNVVLPLVTAITTIALDHTAELGNTLAAIAGEKAGIIKPGVPVVSAPQYPEAAEVIRHIAEAQQSPLYRVGEEITISGSALPAATGQRFSIQGRLATYADIECPLLGRHQQTNAAVAIGIIECLAESGIAVPRQAIDTGMRTVVWPGRLQVLQEHPLLLLDGAHDPASIDALLAALDQHFPGHTRRFIVGFSKEKDWPQMLRQLAPTASEIILTAASTPRAVPPDELARVAAELHVPFVTANTVEAAMNRALTAAAPDDLICVTGSLYMVGDALRWWQQRQ